MMEGSGSRSGSVQITMDPDSDLGGPKTYGSTTLSVVPELWGTGTYRTV